MLKGTSLDSIFGELYKAKNFYEREETKEIKVRAKFTKKPKKQFGNLSKKKARSRMSKASGSRLGSEASELLGSEMYGTPSRPGRNDGNVLFSIKEENAGNGDQDDAEKQN